MAIQPTTSHVKHPSGGFSSDCSVETPVGWFFYRWHVEPMSWHACLVKPMAWHALWLCLGMLSRVVACLVKPKSWHALSSPCRDMPCRANVEPMSWRACLVKPMPWHALCQCLGMLIRVVASPCRDMRCQAYVEACRAHVVACLVPISWHVKPCGCLPCQAHVGSVFN